jgi:hypothetical protein
MGKNSQNKTTSAQEAGKSRERHELNQEKTQRFT